MLLVESKVKILKLAAGSTVEITTTNNKIIFDFGLKVIEFWQFKSKFFARLSGRKYQSTDLAELSAIIFNDITNFTDKVKLRNILLRKFAGI